MRTSNPALTQSIMMKEAAYGGAEAMSIGGAVRKTGVLLLLNIAAAFHVWNLFIATANVGGWMLLGGLGGFIVALITIFNRKLSGVTAPIYAILQGFFLGGISALFETQYPGIVIQAVGLTFGTLFFLLFLYQAGIIRATDKFVRGILAATGAVFAIYLVSFILGLFGVNMPYIHSAGPVGILFSLAVVVIAALNLVLDFDLIERAAESGAPKYMEWYSAFALLVTLIWLYLEMLRLLSKIQQSRR